MVLDINATLDRTYLHEPCLRFRENRRCKVCLSNLVQKAKQISLPIIGLLKPTKTLEYCEVCPSWSPEKPTNGEKNNREVHHS